MLKQAARNMLCEALSDRITPVLTLGSVFPLTQGLAAGFRHHVFWGCHHGK